MLSFESQDNKDVPTSLDYILKQTSCRIHKIQYNDKLTPGRTMFLKEVSRILEFFPIDTASNNFSVSEAKETDTGLIYGVKHQDWHIAIVKLEIVLKFPVQFQGLQETMEIDTYLK